MKTHSSLNYPSCHGDVLRKWRCSYTHFNLGTRWWCVVSFMPRPLGSSCEKWYFNVPLPVIIPPMLHYPLRCVSGSSSQHIVRLRTWL